MNHGQFLTDIYKEAFEHYKETEEKKFNSKFGSLLQDLHLSLEQPVLTGSSSYGSTSCKHQSMFAPNYRVVAACSSAFQKKNFCSPELKASDNLFWSNDVCCMSLHTYLCCCHKLFNTFIFFCRTTGVNQLQPNFTQSIILLWRELKKKFK